MVRLVPPSGTSRTKPRLVSAETKPTSKHSPVRVPAFEASEFVPSTVVPQDAAMTSNLVQALDMPSVVGPRSRKPRRAVLGDVAVSQFEKIVEERKKLFFQGLQFARGVLSTMRREADSMDLSDAIQGFHDCLDKLTRVDVRSRSVSALMKLLGTSMSELEQLESVIWMNTTVCPDGSASLRECCTRIPGAKRSVWTVERNAIVLADGRRHVWRSSYEIPVVRITRNTPKPKRTLGKARSKILYPDGMCFGETIYVQLMDNRHAYQIEIEEADGSLTTHTLMGKGMYATMVREDGLWIYHPLLSDMRKLKGELYVGSSQKGFVHCDEVPDPLRTFAETASVAIRLLDAWTTV